MKYVFIFKGQKQSEFVSDLCSLIREEGFMKDVRNDIIIFNVDKINLHKQQDKINSYKEKVVYFVLDKELDTEFTNLNVEKIYVPQCYYKKSNKYDLILSDIYSIIAERYKQTIKKTTYFYIDKDSYEIKTKDMFDYELVKEQKHLEYLPITYYKNKELVEKDFQKYIKDTYSSTLRAIKRLQEEEEKLSKIMENFK